MRAVSTPTVRLPCYPSRLRAGSRLGISGAKRTCDLIIGVGDGKSNHFSGFQYLPSVVSCYLWLAVTYCYYSLNTRPPVRTTMTRAPGARDHLGPRFSGTT